MRTTGRLVDAAAPNYRWWVLGVTSVGALLAGVGFSAVGAVVSMMRGEHRSYEDSPTGASSPAVTGVGARGRAAR